MAVRETILERELIYEQTPISPPSTQAETPQIPSPVTITSPPKVVTFPSPVLPKDEDELTKYFIQKWRLEQQQAEDGLKIEEVVQEERERLEPVLKELIPETLKPDKGKGHELTITIPKEYCDPSVVECSPSEPRSAISDLDLPLIMPPPIEALQNSNTYYNDGFTTTERAAYENAMVSSSRRAPTPPPVEQPRPSPPPLVNTPTVDELNGWMTLDSSAIYFTKPKALRATLFCSSTMQCALKSVKHSDFKHHLTKYKKPTPCSLKPPATLNSA